MKTYKPHSWLVGAVVLAALTLAACTSGGTSDAPLRILEWTGYQATDFPQFYVPFTQKYTDVNEVVEYSFFAEDAEALARMQAGFEADLVHPCSSWWQLYVDAGLLQPVDTSRLTHWDDLTPELREMGVINGEQYFVPWDWGYESILVRSDLVEEVPDSWADLWDPQYAGHVITIDAGETMFIIGALSLGFDPWNTTPEQNEQIKQHLIDLRPNLLTYWTDYTETFDLPASGDAWLTAGAWQDSYGYLLDEGYEVEYIDPAEGRIGFVCGFGIGATATNLDLIYEYLNAATAPESMANFANEFWYGPSNATVIPMMDEQVVELLGLDNPQGFLSDVRLYQPISQEQREIMTTIWTEVKAAP